MKFLNRLFLLYTLNLCVHEFEKWKEIEIPKLRNIIKPKVFLFPFPLRSSRYNFSTKYLHYIPIVNAKHKSWAKPRFYIYKNINAFDDDLHIPILL